MSNSFRRILTLVLLVSVMSPFCSTVVGGQPHIVFILVDDMGYGDLKCYNRDSKIPTPHMNRLADEGMRFTDAHASGPLCHVSRYGLMTGQYPFRASPDAWRQRATIDVERVTLPSFLKSQGYRTAMVGKWHLGFDENGYDKPLPGGPVDRGFDSYFGIRASTDIPPYFYIRDHRAVVPPTSRIEANNSEGWSPIQGAFWREGGIAPGLELKDVLPKFTDEAVRTIESHASVQHEKPLFLYLAYPAPHTPWLPSEEFQGKSEVGMYGDFTMMVDAMVGRVLKALDDTGMAGETMVVLSSDNGPVWYGEDTRRFGHDSCGGLRGMKADAWEAGHRMPFVVRWPGKVRPGSQSQQTISFVDMLPTAAELVGKELPNGAGPDGVSFYKVLTGQQPEGVAIRDSLVVPSGNGTLTLRKGPWKLIKGLGSGGFTKPARVQSKPGEPAGQLYHLDQDLSESNNLYLQHPDVVKEMEAMLEQIVSGPDNI
jgi:arylsulfatase A-like enzyme